MGRTSDDLRCPVAVSASLAALITHPADVVKTRLQVGHGHMAWAWVG